MEPFLHRVSTLQIELKAPKGQKNTFGGYRYRSCEDILEAVKPLLKKHNLVLTISDDMLQIGDRYYVCATATLRDAEGAGEIKNSAYAREAEAKKGMDESQITGTASSYARKYALNGLFCIDDTKDTDTDEYAERTTEDLLAGKPGNRIPPDKDIPVFCEDCKARFADYWDGDQLIKAADMAERQRQKFGRVLCGKCGKKVAQ